MVLTSEHFERQQHIATIYEENKAMEWFLKFIFGSYLDLPSTELWSSE